MEVLNKILIVLVIAMTFTSCGTVKDDTTLTSSNIPKPTYLQPDTCLTDKQLKQYYKFVKDSLKIELRRDKQIRKKENDSLKIQLKMLKSDNKTVRRSEERRVGKESRYKWTPKHEKKK